MRLILSVILLSLFFSCSLQEKLHKRAHKRWKEKGIHERWIDTTQKATVGGEVQLDTNGNEENANELTSDIKKIINDTCLNKEKEAQIKEIIKYKFIPKVALAAIPDTTITDKNGAKIRIRPGDNGGIYAEAEFPQMIIQAEEPSIPWWIWAALTFSVLLNILFAFILYKFYINFYRNAQDQNRQ
jgi:hypothetical protein